MLYSMCYSGEDLKSLNCDFFKKRKQSDSRNLNLLLCSFVCTIFIPYLSKVHSICVCLCIICINRYVCVLTQGSK